MGALTVEISRLKEKLEEERKLRLVQDSSQVIHLNSFFKQCTQTVHSSVDGI